MDIRDWPIDRIMQLPDNCFGRRFPVCVCGIRAPAAGTWDISEVALPERCIVWEFVSWTDYIYYPIDYFRLALGDQLPTTTVMMDALEPLLPGLGEQGAEPRQIPGTWRAGISLRNLRFPIAAAGRRVVLEVIGVGEDFSTLQVVIVVSSIPTEVPDCLLSV